MRERKSEFSVFIHNLPRSLDRFGLAGIFQKAGIVSDIYIPSRQGTKSQGRFGFVRFYKLKDAWRSIRMFNRGRIRGMRIYVSMAKPKKQVKKSSRDRSKGNIRGLKYRRREWRRKVGVGKCSELSQGQEDQTLLTSITGQTNEDFEVWLESTLVCTSDEPRDLATIASALMEGFGRSFKLRALSCFKFSLTFPTIESMNEALEYQQELQQWFIDIKRWGMEECYDSRRVWLDIIGVSPSWLEVGKL